MSDETIIKMYEKEYELLFKENEECKNKIISNSFKMNELKQNIASIESKSFEIGNKLIFEDEDGLLYKFIIINMDERYYDLLSTTDNDNFGWYQALGLRCLFATSIIDTMFKKYDMKFVKIENKECV